MTGFVPTPFADFEVGGTPIRAADLAHIQTQYASATTDSNAYTDAKAAAVVQVNEAPLSPYRYGAVNPVAGSDNAAALTATIQAAAGSTYTGAQIRLPPGLWRTSQPLPLFGNMSIVGSGEKTRLAAISSNLFEWNANLSGVNMADMWVEGAAAGKGVFAPGAAGGLYGSTFSKMLMVASTDTSFIWNQVNNQSFIQNAFRDCEMQRTATSTVVPFNIVNSGGAANFNKFDDVRFNGLNNVNTPFMRVESTMPATYLTDWTMTNILGEQNPGGLISVLGAQNWDMNMVTDEDSSVDYVANLIEFKANGSGLGSRDITFRNSGRHGRQMAAMMSDIYADPATSRGITVINCNPTPTSQNSIITVPIGSTIIGTRGYPGPASGAGSPEGVVAAPVGTYYMRTDGGTGTAFYVKETGGSTTAGWVGK